MMAGLQTTALLVMVLGPALLALGWSLWLWQRCRSQAQAHAQALQALQDQLTPLRALVHNLDDMAWIKDQRGRFVFVNEAFGRVFGLTPEQIVGKTDFDFSPPSIAAKYQADDLAVMRSGEPSRIEESVARPGGAVEWCETYKLPVINHCGEVVGTAGMVRDVTRRHLAALASGEGPLDQGRL